MPKKKRVMIFLSVVVVVAAVILTVQYLRNWSKSDLDLLTISGNIEVTDAEVSFKIAGRVEKRLVSEGARLEAGQLVAVLDSLDLSQEVALREAELQASQAVLAELEAGSRIEEIDEAKAVQHRAQARLDELLAGSRPQEIGGARAAEKQARGEFVRWQAEFARQKKLFEDAVISSREFEETNAAYTTAKERLREVGENLKLVVEGPRKEEIEQARAALRESRARYELAQKGPRVEKIDRARADVQRAKQALALAETRLGYTVLHSPLTGIVLSENVEPGEYVVAGTPVVTVGNLVNVWLRGYINETDLGRVKVGQTVHVTTDTYPDKTYEGRISFISSEAEFTPKNVQTTEERVKLVYRIKVDIPNPEMELKPGMPADADISLR
ncbi:MAG: efflux RND transporter periplasmic adaptor subunit [Proteobacteria bacterium]|nr:efflux RND transporter periplasmic adaptor subunit [Pseudomonadota bacterium]MBU1058717.1 efflux RND transporter periplasmic adaptor subunit [Pseudomonadota bacterium]